MSKLILAGFFLLCLLSFSCGSNSRQFKQGETKPDPPSPKQVAITFDDMPITQSLSVEESLEIIVKLIDALRTEVIRVPSASMHEKLSCSG